MKQDIAVARRPRLFFKTMSSADLSHKCSPRKATWATLAHYPVSDTSEKQILLEEEKRCLAIYTHQKPLLYTLASKNSWLAEDCQSWTSFCIQPLWPDIFSASKISCSNPLHLDCVLWRQRFLQFSLIQCWKISVYSPAHLSRSSMSEAYSALCLLKDTPISSTPPHSCHFLIRAAASHIKNSLSQFWEKAHT